jgi:hypothetical protein
MEQAAFDPQKVVVVVAVSEDQLWLGVELPVVRQALLAGLAVRAVLPIV